MIDLIIIIPIRFLGRTKFAKDEWVGVELDQTIGKHDGVVEGIRYFQCGRPNTGLFVRASDVELEYEEPIGDPTSPHRHAATKIQALFRGHKQRRSNEYRDANLSISSDTAESSDHLSALSVEPKQRSPRRKGHQRNSSDLARIELEALLKRSSYLRNKPHIMHDLTKLIARRPSTVEMMRSGILNTDRASGASPSTSSKTPRIGWSASSIGADLDPTSRRMFVFGENTHGELGTGDEVDRFAPTELTLPPVKGPKGAVITQAPGASSDFAQVCLGLNHMVVLTLSNEVLTCGSWVANLLGTDDRQNLNRLKRLRQFEDLRRNNPANPIISIGCGDRHTVALHNDGSCESFGGTLYGKLGHRSSGASDNDAMPSSSTYLTISALKGHKVVQMSAGNWHTLCCTTTGQVFSFGGGGKFYNQGQLGHGDYDDSMTPRPINVFGALPASKVFIKSITCGGYHSLALTVDRCVYTWGSGKFGQLGLGTDNNHATPQLVTSLLVRGSGAGRTIGLAAGENHSMCVQVDGSVFSWGYGMQGQCGHGLSANEKLPKKISFFSKRNIVIVQVDAGWRHSIALAENHSVYTWGHGDHGQLGLGDTKSYSTPQLVSALEGLEIKTVAAGGSHSLAFNDFFKAAQELVFMQRVREFKQVQHATKIPMMKGSSMEGTQAVRPGGNAASNADAAVAGGDNQPASRLQSPSNSAAADGPTLPSPNPLVPMQLKSMLRGLAPVDDASEKSALSPIRSPQRPTSVTPQQPQQQSDSSATQPAAHTRQLSVDTGCDLTDDEYASQASAAVNQLNEAFAPSAEPPSPTSQEERERSRYQEEDDEEYSPSGRRRQRRSDRHRDERDYGDDHRDDSKYGAYDAYDVASRRSHSSRHSHYRQSPLSPLHSSSSSQLAIELVYSSQVIYTHRFVTFQTNTDERVVKQMIQRYKDETQHLLLDQSEKKETLTQRTCTCTSTAGWARVRSTDIDHLSRDCLCCPVG